MSDQGKSRPRSAERARATSPARTAKAAEKPVEEPSADAGEAGALGWGGAGGAPGELDSPVARAPWEIAAGGGAAGYGGAASAAPRSGIDGMPPDARVRADVPERACTGSSACA